MTPMAAGNLDDPLSDIPNVVLVDQSAATAAPGAGYVRVEAVNGVLGIRVGSGAWVPLVALAAGLLSGLTEKASPASGDWLLLQDTADSDELKKVDVDNLPGGTGGGGLYDAYLCYHDQKAQNTTSETISSGSWVTRTLNTEVADTAGIGTLSNNEVTLPAGTYVVDAYVPGWYCNRFAARLYNVTGSAVLLPGGQSYSDYGGTIYAASHVHIKGIFTLAVESAIRVEMRVQTTGGGGGVEGNFQTEVYCMLELWRIAA